MIHPNTSKTWMRSTLSVCLLAVATLTGCAVDGEYTDADASDDTGDALTRDLGYANANSLFADSDLEGDQDVSADAVQKVLDGQKGPLGKFTLKGRTAAQIITEESIKNRISPVFMVARIQTETQLITSAKWTSKIPYATSFGCPGSCNAAYAGFDVQVASTAKQFRSYMDNIRAGKYAINGNTLRTQDYGYLVGRTTKTLDPLSVKGTGCNVTPTTAATAAIYTYTPYVGRGVTALCKSTEPGGFGLQLVTYKIARGWFGGASKS